MMQIQNHFVLTFIVSQRMQITTSQVLHSSSHYIKGHAGLGGHDENMLEGELQCM